MIGPVLAGRSVVSVARDDPSSVPIMELIVLGLRVDHDRKPSLELWKSIACGDTPVDLLVGDRTTRHCATKQRAQRDRSAVQHGGLAGHVATEQHRERGVERDLELAKPAE